MMKKGDFLSEQEDERIEKGKVNEVKPLIKTDNPKSLGARMARFAFSNIAKSIATVGVAAVMLFSVAACTTKTPDDIGGNGGSEIETPVDPGIEDPGKDEPGKDEPGIEDPGKDEPGKDDPTEEKVPVEKMESFAKLLEDGNYTYTLTDDGITYKYLIDGTLLEMRENDIATKVYDYTSADVSYLYENRGTTKTGNWFKTITEELFDIDGLIKTPLEGAEWTAYDKETGTFTGTMAGQEMSVILDETDNSLSLVYGNETVGEIFDVNGTNVELPREFVDETVTPEPEPEELIYEIVDGKHVFNIPYLAEVLEKWMIETDYYAKISYGVCPDQIVEKVIYVDPTLEKFDIGTMVKDNRGTHFQAFKIRDMSILTKFKNGELKTAEELVIHLNGANRPFNATGGRISYEYSTDNYNAEQKEQFDTMTKNIFNRLETIGWQIAGAGTKGTIVDGIADAEILFAFKTPAGAESAGDNIGYRKMWEHYYLVKVDEKIKLVQLQVCSSTTNAVSGNELTNVLENNTSGNEGRGWWTVGNYEETELNKDNELIFKTEKTPIYAKYEEKDREL